MDRTPRNMITQQMDPDYDPPSTSLNPPRSDDNETSLRDQIAEVIRGYDWDHGVVSNPEVNEHHRGEADAVMAIVRFVTSGYAATTREYRERAERAEAERDLLRETLAETDLGALTLAQWEAIAAADADRDRLEYEVERLTAYIAEMEAEPEGGEDEPPTDPAELRDLWAFICRDARWKHRLLVKREGERDSLKAAIYRVAEPIRQARRIMTGSSRDWSVNPGDAWLYALLVGWDCEIAEHADGSHDPIDCSGPNHLEGFAERFGWTEGGIAKLRAQRQAIAGLATGTGSPGGKPGWRERARARVGERVDARMKELIAEPLMSAAEFDEAMRRNRVEAEAFLDQQSRGSTAVPATSGICQGCTASLTECWADGGRCCDLCQHPAGTTEEPSDAR